MTILKSNSGKMLEYLTIELQSGWDVNDLADALLVDKWSVQEIEKLTYKEITKAVKNSIVWNGREKIEDAWDNVYNYKTNHGIIVNFINNLKPEFKDREVGDDRIVSVTGAVYSTERSILKDVLSRLYSQRKDYKKESFRLQQKAYDLEQELKKQDND